MTHQVTAKHNKQVLVVTISDPFNFRTELSEVTNELEAVLGTITKTVYLIYDIRKLNIGFSDVVTVATGFARQTSEFEKQLNTYSRVILVGGGTILTVGAKTAARFSPERPFPVFETLEEAVAYAEADLAK